MHVDIDAFFASVEQRRDPRLRGRPVIVGSGVIASCSYEARRYGLRAGMPLYRARRLCPKVVILEGHYPTYRCFADRLFEVCRDIAPAVEIYLDEAYCDLTGTDRIYAHPTLAAETLKRRIREATGLSVSVGLASNRMIAKMAGGAVKPDGLNYVPPGQEARFLGGMPVEKLPGVGHATRAVLEDLNIATVGDLRRLSRSDLERLFGANGLVLYDRCRGRDTRAVHEKEVPRSISRETRFHQDTIDPDEIHAMLYYLTERAAGTLRALGLRSRRVGARLRYSDNASASGGMTLAHSTDETRDLYAAALRQFERLCTRRVSVRLLGVTLSRLSLAGRRQQGLFDEAAAVRRAKLDTCLDQARRRFGHSIIVAGPSLELLGKLDRDSYGYVLRTPCLTK